MKQAYVRRILAAVLVLSLLQPVLPAEAEENLPEETYETVPQELPEEIQETTEPAETEETLPPAETEETLPPAETETTEPPEEPEADPILEELPTVLTVAEALALPAGSDRITTAGTVVFAMGQQAILQDDTGSIRLSFGDVPDIAPGDVMTVTGCRSGGFRVEQFEKTGTGPLPAVESKLSEGRNNQRILVRGAVLEQGSLTQEGSSYSLEGILPETVQDGDRVDAWGVLIDGIFYADTLLPAEEIPEPEAPEDWSTLGGWNFYFGQLHAHSDISDGLGTAEEAFTHARGAENLDFFALTDHSNSFDNSLSGAIDREVPLSAQSGPQARRQLRR